MSDPTFTVAELKQMLHDAEGTEHGRVQARYAKTVSVMPGWKGLKLYAAAPAMARELIALKRAGSPS